MTGILGAIVMVLIGASQNPPPPREGTAKISGVVTRSDINQPLQEVTVRLIRWEKGRGQQLPPVATDREGRFIVEALSAGEYGLRFTADTFVTLEWGQKDPSEIPRRLQLVDGQHFDKADMAMPRTSAIEGRLLDDFGDPAPGMTVKAARVQFAAGKSRLMLVPGAQSRPTDDLGQFRIFNLPPSEYYLVSLSGQFAGPDEAAGFALTYFPGTAVPTDAKPVLLGMAQDVTGLVFQMAPAAMSTLSGVTTDALGIPIQATVVLLPTSGGDVRAEIIARLQSGLDGTFAIRNVPAGSYALHGFGPQAVNSPNRGSASFGALQLTVDGDLPNLVLKISPGVTLRGRILFEGGAPFPVPTQVKVLPTLINFATGPMGVGPTESMTADDWTFEVRNMTGIRVITPPAAIRGWMLKSVMQNGKDITDQPIDFRRGDVNDLEVMLTSNMSFLTGTVTDANGPVTDCVVMVFSQDPAKWTFPSRYVIAARPDARGTFMVPALPPGNYLAIAIPPTQGQDSQSPMSLERYRGLATSVAVLEGGTATLSLHLVKR
jgi:5-hydroxyisourate hydrolase-like protein (transthyretin family)